MMTCLCAFWLAFAPQAPKAPGSPAPSSREDVIVIDGHKDPSKIPEWAAWEDGFTTLDLWAGRDSGFNHDLREALSADEFSHLEREAVAQAARRAEAIRETELLRPDMASMDPKDASAAKKLLDRIHAIDLKYRSRHPRRARPCPSVTVTWIAGRAAGLDRAGQGHHDL